MKLIWYSTDVEVTVIPRLNTRYSNLHMRGPFRAPLWLYIEWHLARKWFNYLNGRVMTKINTFEGRHGRAKRSFGPYGDVY